MGWWFKNKTLYIYIIYKWTKLRLTKPSNIYRLHMSPLGMIGYAAYAQFPSSSILRTRYQHQTDFQIQSSNHIRSYLTQRSPPNIPRHYVELEVFLLIYPGPDIATFTALQEHHAAAFGPVPAAPGGEHRWTVGLTEEEAVVQQHLFLARHRGVLRGRSDKSLLVTRNDANFRSTMQHAAPRKRPCHRAWPRSWWIPPEDSRHRAPSGLTRCVVPPGGSNLHGPGNHEIHYGYPVVTWLAGNPS